MRHLLLSAAVALVFPLLPGCADEPRPSGFRERQNAALADPWNYSPFSDPAKPSVSGGGTTDFNKGAFKRDVDSVFNPR